MLRKVSLSLSLLALTAISACGGADEEADTFESPCVQGFALLNEVQAELQRTPQSSCRSDADCTLLSLRAECGGSQVSSCGTVVHRDALARYDQARTDARFCALIKGSEYGCWAGPSCIASRVVCEAGRCVAQAASAATIAP